MSGLLLAVLVAVPRVADATVCTLPGDCFDVGQVCNLGICTPCGSNFSDGGLNGGLLSCQDPTTPICDVPDGSVGGQCVQCTENANCAGGETCDQGTQTCVPGDGGGADAGIQDAGTRDGASSDGGDADASLHDAGGSETDAAAPSDAASSSDGATETTDGGASENGDGAAGDAASSGDAAGALADGASPNEDASGGAPQDGSSEDGSAEGGSSLDDGAYVEGGGCSCNEVGGGTSVGGAMLACVVALAALRRRRSR